MMSFNHARKFWSACSNAHVGTGVPLWNITPPIAVRPVTADAPGAIERVGVIYFVIYILSSNTADIYKMSVSM